MRSPIADANAGAAMDVAPTKKHAVRAATVAKQGNNQALQDAQQVNKIASTLGTALGNFMEGKRETEMEQRYQKAYHEQGMKTGMSEYQKDLKRTGFTEFIYGGQSPEYQGALDASTRNAANAMLLEEQEFIEGEGMAMTPEQYQQRLQEKLTEYNAENFSDAPDAAFSFMRNWKDNSNELTRAQYKNNQVYQQEQALVTAKEGFHTDLDVVKNTMKSNPDRAVQLGKDLFSGKNKPVGMSDKAYHNMLVDEATLAIQNHDYTALKLMNESGIVGTLDIKQLKAYQTAVKVIDTDNFNAAEAARLNYETVIENDNSTAGEVAAARQRYDSTRIQLAARDTGTSKHLKTVYGADRWRGVLGNQYKDKLQAEIDEGIAERVEGIELNATVYEAELMALDPSERRESLAKRLDSLYTAMHDPSLPPEVRTNLNEQFVSGQKQLEKWESAEAATKKKEDEAQAKKELEEKEQAAGVESLLSGSGYIAADPKSKKAHIKGAIESVANQIIPDTNMRPVDKLEQIFSNPTHLLSFIKGSGKFQNYVVESPEVITAVKNLSVNLRGENSEDNKFTDAQRGNAKALETLQQLSPQLYNASFTAEQRAQNRTLINAINNDRGVAESVRALDTLEQNKDMKIVSKLNGEDLAAKVGVSGAPADVQNAIYTEYRMNLSLGEDEALKAARTFASGFNVKAGGVTVRYGSQFEPINGKNLDDTINILNKTYETNGVYKSGFTRALSSLIGGTKDADGNELYTLKQVPGVKASIFQGGLMLEYNGRVQMIQRPELEAELNGYDKWYRGTASIR